MCFSSFTPFFEWSSEDLEYVIVEGDQVYRTNKEHNALASLLCIDLPKIVNIENLKVIVTFLENVFWFLTENCQLKN